MVKIPAGQYIHLPILIHCFQSTNDFLFYSVIIKYSLFYFIVKRELEFLFEKNKYFM